VDPADALRWLVGMSAAVGIVVNVRHFGLRPRGWLFVQGLILALVLLSAAMKEPRLVYAATAGWVLFVIGPMFARRRQQEFLTQFRFDAAARWAKVMAWLHPFDGVPDQTTFVLAQGELVRGRFDRARELFVELGESASLGELARLELLRLDGEWRRIVEYFDARREARLDPTLAMVYLRALAETGDLSRLLTGYAALPTPVRGFAALRLTVAAFSGRPDLVPSQFPEAPRTRNAEAARSYWLAVALQAKGDVAAATERLERLLTAGMLAPQAKQRLLTPARVVAPGDLTPEAERALAELAREIEEARTLPGRTQKPRRPAATVALSVVLGLVFLVGAFQDGDEAEKLIRMGALVLPPELTGGAAWRVVSAGFVHASATHFIMNVLGLWVLGRSLERAWGSVPMLFVFLGASAGAYTIGLYFMPADLEHPKILLGASAGVLGLVGGLASFAATGYLLHKNRLLGRQLRGAVLIVALQLVFDAYHPVVSSFLHIAGLACGAALALPYALHHFARSKRSALEQANARAA
jgi:rhomboid protease GluP